MLLEKKIGENDSDQRIDRFIKKLCPNLTLSRLHYLFRKKEIKINGKPVPKNQLIGKKQTLQIYGIKQEEIESDIIPPISSSTKTHFPFPILYEDEDLLALDKPPGISVHPGSNTRKGNSVIEIVLAHYPGTKEELFKPSLIHRLDKDTSGILLVAKSGLALRYWTRQWRQQEVDKKYYALAHGVPFETNGEIETTITRVNSKFGGVKSVSSENGGKKAKTLYSVKEKRGSCALLEVKLLTGRLHQIRTHLAEMGNPILGDDRYGNFAENKRIKSEFGLKRIFLHCHQISANHVNGKVLKVNSPLPRDLEKCWNQMAQNF